MQQQDDGTILEANIRVQWVIGNTFPFVVFGSFGEYDSIHSCHATDMISRCLLARLRSDTTTINRRVGSICNRPDKPCDRSHICRLPGLIRILPGRYGPHVLHLPHLLPSHQHLLLLHLLDARLGIRVPQRRLLPARQR